jgi:hypothetical protein
MNDTKTRTAVVGPLDQPVKPKTETHRYGRFSAPAAWAREFRTDLKRVMGYCIVLRAEQMFISDRIEYWAVSEHFRELPIGEMVPEYRWHFTDEGAIWCEEVKA